MNLNDLITDLLYSHDCVVIPGIGGFLLNYAPASIHPVQHLFTPPSRTIVFNSGLDTNDGLLANACAQKYAITYQEAIVKIGIFADDVRMKLRLEGSFSFRGIGRLTDKGDQLIRFEPEKGVNFLGDAYGLPTFTSPAIDRGAYHAVIQPERIDRRPSRAKATVPVGVRWVLMAVPVLLVAIWFLVLPGTDTSSIDMAAIGMTSPVNSKPVIAEPTSESPDVMSAAKPIVTAPDEPVFTETESKTVEPGIAHTVVKEMPGSTIANRGSSNTFHIIAGCFADESNAIRFVENLKSLGYSGSLQGQTRGGLHRVSIGGYSSYQSAVEALGNVRRDVNADAWLMQIN
ncbi:MAG TPA: hypothetical protein DEO70_05075 [Bacteroidales bacterium]|nr:MAG: hypothetical protein A2X11_02000 [Bacteroidetes bacterium GWE2_42_24]OFY28711.1 MAG: hypothetical protein A2X09_12145 [Bacteroidetes bacterium GWF2_43_11]HBZ66190.1 hypothetical protein [Bacteroidales bacterium]